MTGSLVHRLHNPGALRRGAVYVQFDTDADGWRAIYSDIGFKRRHGWKWDTIIARWSERPAAYRRALAGFSCTISP